MNPSSPILLVGRIQELDDDCACPDKAFLLTFDQNQAAFDNDCACPAKAFNVAHEHRSAVDYVFTPDVHTQELSSEYYLIHSPYAAAGPGVLNRPAWKRWQSFRNPQSLQDEIDYQFVSHALLKPVDGRYHSRYTNPETLTAWIHVTNACNLDCPYCYVRKSSSFMDASTGLTALKQIFKTAKQHGFKQVKLKYAGGEATLHFKLIHQLHEEALNLAEENELDLREVVLSNGVRIRPEDAVWLAESKIKLMVSLDGIGEAHDRQRPMKGGGATFSHVEKTIDQVLLPHKIYPDITITLTQLNAGGAADAVRWALARDLPVSLNFYRQNMLTANRQELELEEQAIINGMLAAYKVFEELLPKRPFLNGLLDRVQAEAHAHTCGVQHSYLVINHKGELSQCQMHLDLPVQTSHNGDLLPLVASGPIQNLSVEEKEGCRTCEFRYRCTGGCPLETFRATGRWDVKSPHCRIYKTLLPAALRLEGLRLLKTHNLLSC